MGNFSSFYGREILLVHVFHGFFFFLDDTFLFTVETFWLPMENLIVNHTANTFISERHRGKHQPHIPPVGSGALVGHGFTHPTNIYCIPS